MLLQLMTFVVCDQLCSMCINVSVVTFTHDTTTVIITYAQLYSFIL